MKSPFAHSTALARARRVALFGLLAATVKVATPQVAGAADDLTTSAETLSALSQRFGVPLVAWLGSGDGVPAGAREAEDLRSAIGTILRASPGAWELRDDVLLLSLPPTRQRIEGIHLPSDLSAIRAVLEWVPSDSMVRLARGETLEAAVLPAETTNALRELAETGYWSDELGPHYLRAIDAGRVGLRFQPFATLLAVTADLMPGEWVTPLSTQGEGARREIDWSRWCDWAAVAEPVRPAEALAEETVSIDSGVYSLAELMLAVSGSTNRAVEVTGDCAGRRVYVSMEPMSAARLLRLTAEACCLSVWEEDGAIVVGNAVPHNDARRMNRRNLSFLVELLEPLTSLPEDSQAAQVAAHVTASPTPRLADLPEDLQALVRERCPRPLGPDAELRLIPGFSLCLYPPEGGRCRLLFY